MRLRGFVDNIFTRHTRSGCTVRTTTSRRAGRSAHPGRRVAPVSCVCLARRVHVLGTSRSRGAAQIMLPGLQRYYGEQQEYNYYYGEARPN